MVHWNNSLYWLQRFCDDMGGNLLIRHTNEIQSDILDSLKFAMIKWWPCGSYRRYQHDFGMRDQLHCGLDIDSWWMETELHHNNIPQYSMFLIKTIVNFGMKTRAVQHERIQPPTCIQSSSLLEFPLGECKTLTALWSTDHYMHYKTLAAAASSYSAYSLVWMACIDSLVWLQPYRG